jgi:hypothetical protein
VHVDLVGGTDQREWATGAGSVGHHREAHPRRSLSCVVISRPIPMDAKMSTALRSTMTADGWLVCAEANASSNSGAVAMSISPEQLNTTVVSCRRCSTTKPKPRRNYRMKWTTNLPRKFQAAVCLGNRSQQKAYRGEPTKRAPESG